MLSLPELLDTVSLPLLSFKILNSSIIEMIAKQSLLQIEFFRFMYPPPSPTIYPRGRQMLSNAAAPTNQ